MAGAYNTIVNKISKEIFESWKNQYVQDRAIKGLSFVKDYEVTDRKHRPLEFTLESILEIKPRSKYKLQGESYPGNEEECSHVVIVFNVGLRDFPQRWSDISIDLKDLIRHEIEHLTQSGWNKRQGKDFEDDKLLRYIINTSKKVPYSKYFTLPKEIDAMLHGLYFKAKKQRKPFTEVVLEDLSRFKLGNLEIKEIIYYWNLRVKSLSLPHINYPNNL